MQREGYETRCVLLASWGQATTAGRRQESKSGNSRSRRLIDPRRLQPSRSVQPTSIFLALFDIAEECATMADNSCSIKLSLWCYSRECFSLRRFWRRGLCRHLRSRISTGPLALFMLVGCGFHSYFQLRPPNTLVSLCEPYSRRQNLIS